MNGPVGNAGERRRFSFGPVGALARFMVRRGRWQLGKLLALMWLASITEGISLLLLLPVMNLIHPDDPNRGLVIRTGRLAPWLGSPMEVGLGTLLILFVALIIFRALLVRARDIVNAGVLQDLANGLRNELFLAVAKSRWSYLARLRASDINHALTSDIDRVRAAATALIQILQTAVLLAIYMIGAIIVSPRMSMIALVIGGIVMALLAPVRRLALAHGTNLSLRGKEQYRILSEFLAGMKVAKATNTEPQYVRRMRDVLDNTREGTVRFMRIYTLSGLVFQVGTAAGLALFVWAAATQVHVAFASIVTLVLLFMRIGPRLAAVHGSGQMVLTNLPALQVMLDLKAACASHAETVVQFRAGELRRTLRLDREIRFDNVSFDYGGDREGRVLEGVSFAIRANRITALIGPSGSGKSTIADLLMGLLEPVSGVLRVDDEELTTSLARVWRTQIAYVPQDCFLLHDTIAENLRMGRTDLPDQALWRALEQANATVFVGLLPEQMATVVGDRGHWLSGGERQRIALARALLRQPRLLILDEATSALDWESQARIAQCIQSLRGELTVLTIAHRPSMVSFADDVVAIERGRVVSAGDFSTQAGNEKSYLSRILREADVAVR